MEEVLILCGRRDFILVIVLGQGSALLQDAYRHRATAVEGGESPFRSDAQCPYSQVPKVCLFSLVAERVFVFLKPALLSVTLSC